MVKKNDPTLAIRRGKIVKVRKEVNSTSFRRENNPVDVEIPVEAQSGQEISTPTHELGLSREDESIPNFSVDEARATGTLINDESQSPSLGATAVIRDVFLSGSHVSIPSDPNYGVESNSDISAFQEISNMNEIGISNLDKSRDEKVYFFFLCCFVLA